jgi:hypothetical protein
MSALAGLLAAAALHVTGGDLAWKIETRYMVVDLTKNSGTGRNGQINTIFLKEPGVSLTRARATSTLHLSPNAAAGGQWRGINRWDPPAKWSAKPGADRFTLAREGEMPQVPGLWVRTSYEFSDSPAIAVEEFLEARQDVRVSLLRFNEYSFATGEENPFTHVAWEDAEGRVHTRRREAEMELPAGTRWQAFLNEPRAFGFASVVEAAENSPGAVLVQPCARFAGDPHYFYRILVHSAGPPLVEIPKGTWYKTRYWLYYFRPEKGSPDAVSKFYRKLRSDMR